jgi:hypothetical protein
MNNWNISFIDFRTHSISNGLWNFIFQPVSDWIWNKLQLQLQLQRRSKWWRAGFNTHTHTHTHICVCKLGGTHFAKLWCNVIVTFRGFTKPLHAPCHDPLSSRLYLSLTTKSSNHHGYMHRAAICCTWLAALVRLWSFERTFS